VLVSVSWLGKVVYGDIVQGAESAPEDKPLVKSPVSSEITCLLQWLLLFSDHKFLCYLLLDLAASLAIFPSNS